MVHGADRIPDDVVEWAFTQLVRPTG